MLDALVDNLYTDRPNDVLFHYTSLVGLKGIVESRNLWASEIRYLNDAHEIRHMGHWLDAEVGNRIGNNDDDDVVLHQFRDWLPRRMADGPLVFVGSFTEDGNLLSQWRGYCEHGKGVSIGFSNDAVAAAAAMQNFKLGRCIYEARQKQALVEKVVDAVLGTARKCGPSSDLHPSNSFHNTFADVEPALLHIAALMKDRLFHQEREWRIVSATHANYVSAPIKYREGRSTLIPYVELPLSVRGGGNDPDSHPVLFDQVYVGPGPNAALSINSVAMYLSKYGSSPRIINSMSSLRET